MFNLSLSGKVFLTGVASYLAGSFIRGYVKGARETQQQEDNKQNDNSDKLPSTKGKQQ